jgi:succinate dehydrogenase assembly factor 2
MALAALRAATRHVRVRGRRALAAASDLPAEAAERAALRDRELRARHHALRTDVPAHSLAPGSAAGDLDADALRRKRLVYRAKQRGWLEVDLLLGTWASQHVPSLPASALDEVEALLRLETIDAFNVIAGLAPPPPGLDGPVLRSVQAFARSSPLGAADPDGYRRVKAVMSN